MPIRRSQREPAEASRGAAPALISRAAVVRAGLLVTQGLLAFPAARATEADAVEKAPRYELEASVTHDRNLTRGRVAGEKRSDEAYGLQVSREWVVPLSSTRRIMLTGTIGGETFGNHRRLGRGFGEGQATLEYRASGEFSAPTFGVFARAAGDAYRSTLRSGYRYAVGATVSQALTDRINVVGTLTYDRRHARSAVFSGNSHAARLHLDYASSDNGTFYLGGDFRRGDTTAAGFGSLENIDIAKVFVSDDAFAAPQLLSYRFEGRTMVGVLGYNHGLGPKSAIDVSWRHAVTKPRSALPFASSVPNRYVANQLAVSVLWRF